MMLECSFFCYLRDRTLNPFWESQIPLKEPEINGRSFKLSASVLLGLKSQYGELIDFGKMNAWREVFAISVLYLLFLYVFYMTRAVETVSPFFASDAMRLKLSKQDLSLYSIDSCQEVRIEFLELGTYAKVFKSQQTFRLKS